MSNSPFDAKIPDHWLLSTLDEIKNKPLIQPKWIIEGLLLEQSGTLVSGLPHACKSLNWLYAALESVTTHTVWGHFACPNVKRVLYVETEDPQILVESRVQQLAKGLPPLREGCSFTLAATGPFNLTDAEAKLMTLIDQVKPDWMVLSTLQGLLGGRDWKEQSDMGPVNAVFVRVSRRAPITVITHSPWNMENKRAAGTVTQAANFLTLMHFEKTISQHGTIITVQVDSKMGNELPSFDLVLKTEGKLVTKVEYHASTIQERAAEYLIDHPLATPAEVARAMKCNLRTAQRAKKRDKVQ
jgi:hypothetical protein